MAKDWRLIASSFLLPHTGHTTMGSLLLSCIVSPLSGHAREPRNAGGCVIQLACNDSTLVASYESTSGFSARGRDRWLIGEMGAGA